MPLNYEVISPLPFKSIDHDPWIVERHPNKIPVYERVLFFDPTTLYERVVDKINPTKRHQGLQMEDIFPKQSEPLCACGCGEIPKHGTDKMKDGSEKSWHRKWASDACQSFASDVLSIMNNYFGKPAFYVSFYHGEKCAECDETSMLELDHVVGVKHGGGACWLSNYKWLCKTHHTKKTNKSFSKGEFKNDR